MIEYTDGINYCSHKFNWKILLRKQLAEIQEKASNKTVSVQRRKEKTSTSVVQGT